MLPKEYQSGGGIEYKNYDKIKIKVPFRMLVVGSSGSGKTNCVMNLISLMNCFTKIYLFAKNTSEPLYQFLIDSMRKVEKKIKRQVIFVSNELSDMPQMDEIDPEDSSLFIFDDMISESVAKQKSVMDLFIRGRKQNASAIYISQSYFDISKIVRKNADIIIIKKINTKRDLTSIVKEYNLDDVTPEDLLGLYKKIVAKDFTRFLLIDTNTNDSKLKFRDCFDGIDLSK